MRILNRLKWLQAFEATARHGSFTGAADELGVTPAAVGQLVRALEEWVGHPLLTRSRSGSERLRLVSDVHDALDDITLGLDKLESGLKKLRGRNARSVVVVTASQVLVMNWLMPRLNRFSEHHSNVDIRLDVADRLTDLAHGEADIGIRCGPGNWPGLQTTWLMDEEVVMVCSPSLLSTTPEINSAWLYEQKLIQDDTPHPGANFPAWESVLQKLGLDAVRQSHQHINSTAAVIQAVLSGQGITLVRKALVQQDLDIQRLVQLFPEIKLPIAWSYYLVCSAKSQQRPEVQAFHDWIRGEVEGAETAARAVSHLP
ncbi:LysR substrate-binding domain-containing protein [Rahnella laticis]|uniref:LysR substrate-binding domain-containing protein n=1 Tax=Rahnella laticis TaxID=2787622 RepID=UPI0018A2A970|nr:LysR substrate-binding domain-containing protein [Rahnella laticis]MBF7995749.1 LysR family transcriptional regulator [Rahnella laticis]